MNQRILPILIFLSFTCLFCMVACQSQPAKYNAWTSNNLNGRVRSMKLESFECDSMNGEFIAMQRTGVTEQFEFSTKAHELFFKLFDSKDSLLVSSIPVYSGDSITGVKTFNGRKEMIEQWKITKYALGFYGEELQGYDSTGKLIKKVFNKINSKGHRTEMKLYNMQDSLLYKETLKYDNKENITERTTNTPDITNSTTVTITITYRYTKFDQRNNWIERVEYNGDYDVLITKRTIEYFP